jgi:hypothetical protein
VRSAGLSSEFVQSQLSYCVQYDIGMQLARFLAEVRVGEGTAINGGANGIEEIILYCR